MRGERDYYQEAFAVDSLHERMFIYLLFIQLGARRLWPV